MLTQRSNVTGALICLTINLCLLTNFQKVRNLLKIYEKYFFLPFLLGNCPIWIEKKHDYDDLKVLDFIQIKMLSHEENVTQSFAILISPLKDIDDISRWAEHQHERWQIIKYSDVTGCEFKYVVAFIEDERINLEVFSRAQRQLIIVTM